MSMDPWFFQRWAHQQHVGNPTRKLILTSLATMAEANTGYCRPSQQLLADYAECDERTVRRHVGALTQAGLLAKRHRHADGRRVADEYLLLAPGVSAWPDGSALLQVNLSGSQPGDLSGSLAASTGHDARLKARPTGQPGSSQPDRAVSGELSRERPVSEAVASERTRARRSATKIDQGEIPPSLPAELHGLVAPVLEILREIWQQRGGLEPTTRGVGLAIAAYKDRDHLEVARAVEYWLISGNGRAADCGDVTARFRRFLRTSPPMQRPAASAATAATASNVVSLGGRRAEIVRQRNAFLDAPEYQKYQPTRGTA